MRTPVRRGDGETGRNADEDKRPVPGVCNMNQPLEGSDASFLAE